MRLSPNFTTEEFRCRCGCGQLIVDARLVLGLQQMREVLGVPVRILSGYRCQKHNLAVGGAADSHHVSGRASDISGADLVEMRRQALLIPQFKGIGLDRARGFLHVDVRDSSQVVEWSYVDGKAA